MPTTVTTPHRPTVSPGRSRPCPARQPRDVAAPRRQRAAAGFAGWLALATLAFAVAGSNVVSGAEPGSRAEARISFVESFHRDEKSPWVTAIGLRWTPAETPRDAARVVLLVDTSASQGAEYRRRSREALTGLLGAAGPGDTFLPAAVDVACVPLAEDFQTADAPALTKALDAIDARTPLGSTDLVAVLERAAELFPGPVTAAPRAIVYVGDGPGFGGVDPFEFYRVLEGLRIEQELAELRKDEIALGRLLGSEAALRRQVGKEIEEDARKYGDARRTLIEAAERAAVEAKVLDEPVTVINAGLMSES